MFSSLFLTLVDRFLRSDRKKKLIMEGKMVVDTAMEFLVPSWWEVQVTLAATVFMVVAYWFFSLDGDGCGCGGDDRALVDGSGGGADVIDDKYKVISVNFSDKLNLLVILVLCYFCFFVFVASNQF